MLTLNFTVKQIAFSLYNVWRNLGLNANEISFKYQLLQQLKQNSELTRVLSVSIDKGTLIRCYINVSQQPYGVSTDMAEELLDSLRTQLLEKASIEGEEQQDAIDTLTAIQELKVKDVENCNRNIQESLSIILQ